MKKLDVNFESGYIALSQKIIFSFDPPAGGILERNIFTGDYRISENSRAISRVSGKMRPHTPSRLKNSSASRPPPIHTM